jgi:hypothetical protein
MQGKMGPSAQFIPGLPKYNTDWSDPNFYTFSDNNEDEETDVHGDNDE